MRSIPTSVAVVLALHGRAFAEPEKPLPRDVASTRQLSVQLGSSHWYGPTVGTPVGLTTPAIVVGARPGLRWLELRLGYTRTVKALALATTGEKQHVGFVNLDAAITHELRADGQRMVMGGGPLIGFVHATDGSALAIGAALFARYLIDVTDTVAAGPYLDVRIQYYAFPGSGRGLGDVYDAGESDLQSQLGVALTFW